MALATNGDDAVVRIVAVTVGRILLVVAEHAFLTTFAKGWFDTQASDGDSQNARRSTIKTFFMAPE